MNQPISVVMAVHNDAEYCGDAIESILRQTFTDFEFIIVDDGSTDETPAILKECASRDPRVRLISHEHQGAAMSRNVGITLASGVYIASMDGDDRSLPHRLEVLYSVLNSDSQIGLVGGNSEVIDEQGRIIGYRIINTLDANMSLRRRCIYQGGDVVFRKDLWAAVGGYRVGFRFSQDYDLWLRMSDHAQGVKVPEITYQWRVSSESPTLTKMPQHDRFADLARLFADQRRATGRDSYTITLPEMTSISSDNRQDSAYALLWIALVKLRDIAKAAAAGDLKKIVRLKGRWKWKVIAWITLLLPQKVTRIFLC